MTSPYPTHSLPHSLSSSSFPHLASPMILALPTYILCLSQSATHLQVIQDHAEEFLKVMNSKEIALQLRALDLIPESVEHDILHSSSRGKANAHLLIYLKSDATVKTVQEIFKFATEEASYEKMNAFATNMLRELQ